MSALWTPAHPSRLFPGLTLTSETTSLPKVPNRTHELAYELAVVNRRHGHVTSDVAG